MWKWDFRKCLSGLQSVELQANKGEKINKKHSPPEESRLRVDYPNYLSRCAMRHNGTASIPAISDSRVCARVRPGDIPVCVCECVC